MTAESQIWFPLASNAAALYAGPGVAGVRRRILAAGLLMDHVILESGLVTTWAGPDGASTMRMPAETREPWQTTGGRHAVTRSRHYFSVRSSDAPATAPFQTILSSEASFSWSATFEPFRAELPASAASWLHMGRVEDSSPAKELVRTWESSDRLAELQGLLKPLSTPEDRFALKEIVKAGYFDLASGAVTGSAVSIDRRHASAINRRMQAGDAVRVGGAYAMELMLPTDISWDDVHDLRQHKAMRDYRALIREVEEAALEGAVSINDLNDLIHREYQSRLTRAAAKGLPFGGRVGLTAVGFVLGVGAEFAVPLVGGATVAAGGFAVGEIANKAMRPRWLAVDRRLRGRRSGL